VARSLDWRFVIPNPQTAFDDPMDSDHATAVVGVESAHPGWVIALNMEGWLLV
jgi:hypothetical protein